MSRDDAETIDRRGQYDQTDKVKRTGSPGRCAGGFPGMTPVSNGLVLSVDVCVEMVSGNKRSRCSAEVPLDKGDLGRQRPSCKRGAPWCWTVLAVSAVFGHRGDFFIQSLDTADMPEKPRSGSAHASVGMNPNSRITCVFRARCWSSNKSRYWMITSKTYQPANTELALRSQVAHYPPYCRSTILGLNVVSSHQVGRYLQWHDDAIGCNCSELIRKDANQNRLSTIVHIIERAYELKRKSTEEIYGNECD